MGVVGIGEETEFAFALAALILSISNVFEIFAGQNKIAEKISYILEILALSVIILLPSLKDFVPLKKIMSISDVNVLLILTFVFTFVIQVCQVDKI